MLVRSMHETEAHTHGTITLAFTNHALADSIKQVLLDKHYRTSTRTTLQLVNYHYNNHAIIRSCLCTHVALHVCTHDGYMSTIRIIGYSLHLKV